MSQARCEMNYLVVELNIVRLMGRGQIKFELLQGLWAEVGSAFTYEATNSATKDAINTLENKK